MNFQRKGSRAQKFYFGAGVLSAERNVIDMAKYQASKDYIMREVAGETILLSRGASTVESNNVMVFNETGALIYRAMVEPVEIDDLANALVEKYGIESGEAKADTETYVAKMLEAGIIEEV